MAIGTAAMRFAAAQAPVAPPPSRTPRVDLTAPAQDHVVELFPEKSKASQNPLRLTFRGWIYMPEGLSFTAPDAAKFPAEEQRLIEALTESKKRGIQAVVPYWAPAEQANVRKTVSEPSVSTGMTGFLRSVENSIFLAKILY